MIQDADADTTVPLTPTSPLSSRARPHPPPRHSVQRQCLGNHVNVHPPRWRQPMRRLAVDAAAPPSFAEYTLPSLHSTAPPSPDAEYVASAPASTSRRRGAEGDVRSYAEREGRSRLWRQSYVGRGHAHRGHRPSPCMRTPATIDERDLHARPPVPPNHPPAATLFPFPSSSTSSLRTLVPYTHRRSPLLHAHVDPPPFPVRDATLE
ncbi:hypothetical protein B0H14DRAFT_3526018 [Mycena olivaceomarginata]|nr:hypothetical protein B0H14DRAFT_3526018 [Mycena olivaceomarginata]